jgi:hypothetical protein
MRVEVLLALLLCATGALAQEAGPGFGSEAAPQAAPPRAEPPKPAPVPELPEGATLHARKKPVEHLKLLDGHLITGDLVSADDVVDEMVDELAADLAKLGAAHISPILLERVRVSDNMNPQYSHILEARLASAMFRAANVALVRCAECWTTRSRVEQSSYVITRGMASRADVQKVAAHYGARTYLDVSLTLHEQPSSLTMDVELVRADDSSIAFAEYYRLDPEKAILYRGADTAQHREARLQMLQDRVNARPRFGHTVDLGAMMIPSNAGSVWGGLGRYQLTETFGSDEQYAAGLSLAGFLNTTSFAGGILGAVWQARMSDGGVWAPEWTVALHGGAMITGNAGNSVLAGARLRALVGARISMEAGLSYLVPFQLRGKGTEYGGFCPELGVGFVWR